MSNDNPFRALHQYVQNVQRKIGATAAAAYVIRNGQVALERYSGRHAEAVDSRPVDRYSRFNVGSVRKTYLGLAVSLLIDQGLIASIDQEIGHYLPEYERAASGVTLRHLLTHTHGLIDSEGILGREFEPGESWAYRNAGIDLLIQLVYRVSGRTLSAFLHEHVFRPYGLAETGWETAYRETLIYNYYDDPHAWVGPNDSDAGDQSNLFVSAKDLAKWGYLHLRRGSLDGERSLPPATFERVTSAQTPDIVPARWPRNGFLWWLQHDTPLNQLGERLPNGSYLVLGITGCACIVVPEYDAVVVRMYNQLRNPDGYDYLDDIRAFGNLAGDLLQTCASRDEGRR